MWFPREDTLFLATRTQQPSMIRRVEYKFWYLHHFAKDT